MLLHRIYCMLYNIYILCVRIVMVGWVFLILSILSMSTVGKKKKKS